MKKFDNHLFRCHQLGDLMTNDRSGKKMGQTAISKLIEIWWDEMYGVRKTFTTKQMDKGRLCESDAIQLLGDVVYEGKYLLNNQERFGNEYISGEPDVITEDIIHDTKVSWDATTYANASLTKGYEYQGRGYMWLLGIDIFELNPCLINTPENLIMDEKRRLAYYLGDIEGTSDEYLKGEREIDASMRFDHIPKELRLTRIQIARDTEIEEKIIDRIIECREFLNNYNPSRIELITKTEKDEVKKNEKKAKLQNAN